MAFWSFVPDIRFQLVSGPPLSPFKVAKDWARERRPEFPARDKEVLENILLKNKNKKLNADHTFKIIWYGILNYPLSVF